MVPALMFCSIVSQAIARLGGKHNFYDALLLQDGHELIRIKPPRDLESWQNLPVSEIARTRPVILPDLQRKTMESYLASYPYRRFPVVVDGKLLGIVTRDDMTAALATNSAPRLSQPVECAPNLSVRKVGSLLMESAAGIVLVRDASRGGIASVVTLHDLLRAQAALAE
ncbi:MAG TPA: CBS domain-containing protein, partial [Spirochaetia bacterium]|nr:CBS domain-containing protein [Spirochaetia bacterium]